MRKDGKCNFMWMTIKRGDIFFINGSRNDFHVQRGNRPAVIVSNDFGNKYSDVVEVVFLTTAKKKPLPTHVTIKACVLSTALCEQICSIPIERIGNYIRSCTEEEMKAIDKALKISLALTPLHKKEGDD